MLPSASSCLCPFISLISSGRATKNGSLLKTTPMLVRRSQGFPLTQITEKCKSGG